MTDQKPTWFPQDSTYYEISSLKPDFANSEKPHTLFGFTHRTQPGYLHDASGKIIGKSTGIISYRWNIVPTKEERLLFALLQARGAEEFFRMYQGLDLAVMSYLKQENVLRVKEEDRSPADYFSRIDRSLVTNPLTTQVQPK